MSVDTVGIVFYRLNQWIYFDQIYSKHVFRSKYEREKLFLENIENQPEMWWTPKTGFKNSLHKKLTILIKFESKIGFKSSTILIETHSLKNFTSFYIRNI